MKQRRKVEAPRIFDYARLATIQPDPEFRNLAPLPRPDESDELFRDTLEAGVSAPLIVWRWQERLILLVGYQVFPALRNRRMSFPVIIKAFRHRGEARHFVMRHHLRHGILSRLMLSYIRGQRCLPEKQSRGRPMEPEGTVPPAGRTNFGSRKTMGVMAETHGVSRETLRLDMAFAQAVDQLLIVRLEGEDLERMSDLAPAERQEIKRLLLGRESKVSRGRVVALTRVPAAEQVDALRQLIETGRLPRFRNESIGDPRRVAQSLEDDRWPLDDEEMPAPVRLCLSVGRPDEQARELVEQMGWEAAVQVSRSVLALPRPPGAEDEAVPSVPERNAARACEAVPVGIVGETDEEGTR